MADDNMGGASAPPLTFEGWKLWIDGQLEARPSGARLNCLCGQPLRLAELKGYLNPVGYAVTPPNGGEADVLWLYLACPCGTDWALWKLNIPLPGDRNDRRPRT